MLFNISDSRKYLLKIKLKPSVERIRRKSVPHKKYIENPVSNNTTDLLLGGVCVY